MASENVSPRETVIRAEGVTNSERYLKKLCDRTFLSLWSYPGVFRDQGRVQGKGDGKEVCDLLVVFENHILIFSDKDIHFGNTKDIPLAWGRWFKKAVLKSAEQVWGAERWIKQFPSRLYLDKRCTASFPIELPDPKDAVFHRIVVAHDASRICKQFYGGSGSLMLESDVAGQEHLKHPFTIGHIESNKGYVHVFDDTSLEIVMKTLDTVSDFVGYLTKKEHLFTSGIKVFAAGEEELLAQYLKDLNKNNEHDFIFPHDIDGVLIPEGEWTKFLNSREHKAQIQANEISYAWDSLIETFLGHLTRGTQHHTNSPRICEQEQAFRWLARENRTRRRLLANMLLGLLKKTPSANYRATRLVMPSQKGDPYYIFLLLPRSRDVEDEHYRQIRREMLGCYCQVMKFQFPEAKHIIGIATEPLTQDDLRSEDFMYLDAREWNEELNEQARTLKNNLGIFVNVETFRGTENEYPIDVRPTIRVGKNSVCICGSGKRYKRCCGRGMFGKNGNA